MRRLILAFSLGTAWALAAFPVRANNLERKAEGEDVTVTVSSPFSDLPPGGCMPFRITVRNDRNTPGTWRVYFEGVSNSMSLGACVFEQNVTAAPNSSGAIDVLVPVPVVSAEKGSMNLNIGVDGPGFNAGSRRFFGTINSYSSNSRSSYTLIGRDVLGTIGTGPLESHYERLSRKFYGSEVDPETLPTDWRAFSGVSTFVLSDSGWLGLSSAQRGAVCDYVAQGGQLILFTTQNSEARIAQLQLPEPDGKPGPYGFGTIWLHSAPGFPPEAYALAGLIEQERAASAGDVDQNFSTWNLRHLVGTIAVNGTFILLFVVLFGSLIGPVNLFVFARGKNRFRLFWTTPLISLVASLALIAGILVTDGLGGTGRQMIAIFSLPGANREAVIQEEIARTAVLFSHRWRNDQNYLMTPVSAHALSDAIAPLGRRVYANADLVDSPDTFHQAGNEYSGSWFRSRAISGQYLQAVRPSRSSLTLLNPPAPGASVAPPVVLSSFPGELTKVYLRDLNGGYWTCTNLEPGRKMTCVSCTDTDYHDFWSLACQNAGGKLQPLLKEAGDRLGCFYATGIPPEGDRLATLSEIRWQVTTGLYLGPLVTAAAPGGGP